MNSAPLQKGMGVQYTVNTLNVNQPVIINLLKIVHPTMIWVNPGGNGVGVQVYYSLDNQMTWKTWPTGGVISYTEWIFPYPVTALKILQYSGPSGQATYGYI